MMIRRVSPKRLSRRIGSIRTTPYFPIIVEISLTLDEKTYSVRSVYSSDIQLNKYRSPEGIAVLSAALHKSNAALVATLLPKYLSDRLRDRGVLRLHGELRCRD